PRIMSPSSTCRRLCAVLLAIAPSLTASTGAAQSPATEAPSPRLQQDFADARKLFDQNNFSASLQKFEGVLAATGSPNARLYVARAPRELKGLPGAYDQMAEPVRGAAVKGAAGDSKYEPTRDQAASELAQLEPLVSHVALTVIGATAGTTVTIDDTVIP